MKLHFFSYLSVLLLLSILGSSCHGNGEVLNRKKMEQVMYDVYIAEAIMDNDYSTFNTPQKKEAFINSVFKKHNITQMQWDSSLSYYSDNTALYIRINDSVRAKIDRDRKSIDDKLTQTNLASQRKYEYSQASFIPKTYSFAERANYKDFYFRIDSAEISKLLPDNEFEFGFKVIGIPADSTVQLRSVLALNYKDTTVYQVNEISKNRAYTLKASKYLPKDTLKSMSGFVYRKPLPNSNYRIQLFDIYLGKKLVDSLSNDTTALKSEEAILDKEIRRKDDRMEEMKLIEDTVQHTIQQ